MNRRAWLRGTGAAALGISLGGLPLAWTAAADGKTKRILMLTRSQGYEHSVVKRRVPSELSHAERIVTDLGAKRGFEVTATKDGRVFLPGELDQYDAFFFYTSGDLTKEGGDKNPPMPPEGKEALLKAIADGKGFIGAHCASDTFHSPGKGNENQTPDQIDPYIAMLGGEFITHGEQLKAKMVVADKSFPGTKGLEDFTLYEEWYALKNFAPNLHVILAQDTAETLAGFEEKRRQGNAMYQRPVYPATWARKHDQGRVFYTSMGHREDVWTNPVFQQILLGGIAWALGQVEADAAPNMDQVTPKARQLKS
jgi:hypothetical protein